MEKMKTHSRRNFLMMLVSGFFALGASLFRFRSAVPKKEKPLKEADFYSKHTLAG